MLGLSATTAEISWYALAKSRAQLVAIEISAMQAEPDTEEAEVRLFADTELAKLFPKFEYQLTIQKANGLSLAAIDIESKEFAGLFALVTPNISAESHVSIKN